jgi:hypothetical protein
MRIRVLLMKTDPARLADIHKFWHNVVFAGISSVDALPETAPSTIIDEEYELEEALAAIDLDNAGNFDDDDGFSGHQCEDSFSGGASLHKFSSDVPVALEPMRGRMHTLPHRPAQVPHRPAQGRQPVASTSARDPTNVGPRCRSLFLFLPSTQSGSQ